MKMLRKLLRDRKGITMTEVIIAMAAVILVSGAAISLLIASVQFDSKYDSQTRALNACESAVHCLRFTDEESELEGYLVRLGFYKEAEGVFALADCDTAVEVANISGVWTVTFGDDIVYEKN